MDARFLVAVAVVGLVGWYVAVDDGASPQASADGFTRVPMGESHREGTVYVMIPPGCPSDRAAHGRSLVQALEDAGIPTETVSRYRASMSDGGNVESLEAARDKADRVGAVIEQGPPVVFINGYAQSYPTAEAVKEQYRAVAGR